MSMTRALKVAALLRVAWPMQTTDDVPMLTSRSVKNVAV
jgi:hypothetical protein